MPQPFSRHLDAVHVSVQISPSMHLSKPSAKPLLASVYIADRALRIRWAAAGPVRCKRSCAQLVHPWQGPSQLLTSRFNAGLVLIRRLFGRPTSREAGALTFVVKGWGGATDGSARAPWDSEAARQGCARHQQGERCVHHSETCVFLYPPHVDNRYNLWS